MAKPGLLLVYIDGNTQPTGLTVPSIPLNPKGPTMMNDWLTKFRNPQRRRRNSAMPLEALEERVMLTGDVTAVLQNGDLKVTGDSGDNVVLVLGGGGIGALAPGFTIIPFEGTTINGDPDPLFIATEDPVDDMLLNFKKGGDNTVGVRNMMTLDDIIYKGGKQADVFGLDGVGVGGDVNAKTGKGDDVFGMQYSSISANLKLNTSSGDDKVGIQHSSIDGDLIGNTGSGNDAIGLLDVFIGDDVKAKTGSGDDIVLAYLVEVTGALNLNLGSGNDGVYAESSFLGGGGLINGGSGLDGGVLIDVDGSEEPTIKGFEADFIPGLEGIITDFEECMFEAFDVFFDE